MNEKIAWIHWRARVTAILALFFLKHPHPANFTLSSCWFNWNKYLKFKNKPPPLLCHQFIIKRRSPWQVQVKHKLKQIVRTQNVQLVQHQYKENLKWAKTQSPTASLPPPLYSLMKMQLSSQFWAKISRLFFLRSMRFQQVLVSELCCEYGDKKD